MPYRDRFPRDKARHSATSRNLEDRRRRDNASGTPSDNVTPHRPLSRTITLLIFEAEPILEIGATRSICLRCPLRPLLVSHDGVTCPGSSMSRLRSGGYGDHTPISAGSAEHRQRGKRPSPPGIVADGGCHGACATSVTRPPGEGGTTGSSTRSGRGWHNCLPPSVISRG